MQARRPVPDSSLKLSTNFDFLGAAKHSKTRALTKLQALKLLLTLDELSGGAGYEIIGDESG